MLICIKSVDLHTHPAIAENHVASHTTGVADHATNNANQLADHELKQKPAKEICYARQDWTKTTTCTMHAGKARAYIKRLQSIQGNQI